MPELAIQIKDLKKSYQDVFALKGVNVDIPKGEFFGLLGPNGAGKTTTINILTGLVFKDSGNCLVFGKDTVSDYRFTRSKICLLYTSPSPRDKRQSRMPSSA